MGGGVACDAKHDELAAYDEEIKDAVTNYGDIILGVTGGADENGAADTQIFRVVLDRADISS